MADGSTIEWTDASWNAVRGCTRISPGCGGPNHQGGCYAEKIAARFSGPGQPFEGFARRTAHGGAWTGKLALIDDMLTLPLRWRKPRRIFVNSMSDLFHEALPDEAIDKVFAVMALTPHHTYQVLTKRAERMREYMLERWQPAPAQRLDLRSFGLGIEELPAETEGADRHSQVYEVAGTIGAKHGLIDTDNDAHWDDKGDPKALAFKWPLPNVWLGVSTEDQPRFDERMVHLRATPAAVRWISAEPLLGAIDARRHLDALNWVVAGGESGPGARPSHPDWFRSLRDQCSANGVPYFFKQWGAWLADHHYCDPDAEQPEEPCDCRTGSECHITPTGELHDDDRDGQPPARTWTMRRVGKGAAGNVLDGRTHQEWPR